MDRLRIGVIGLGWFGEIHCETIVGVPSVELAALCTRTPERLAALGGKFGVTKTYTRLPRPAGRSRRSTPSRSCTMWDQHTEPAVAALAAGKHVFLEKPMASTVADCQAIVEAAAQGARASSSGRPHLPLQPALPDGQAGDRRRARSARSSRSTSAATSRPRGRRRSSTRSARSSATRSTTPT